MAMIEPHEIYTVSQLNTEARILVENTFKSIWITGEVSNLSRPSSGHIYFSLKDDRAQIRCALFRNSQRGMKFNLENGQQVLVHAQVSLYEARGDFQLIAFHVELAGEGALQIAFEKLKNRLAKEGLFDEAHKLPIPRLPKKIGVITSSSAAALHDILTVLRRRFASIPVIIYPSMVQGDQAAGELVSAIQIANQRKECDILILARGGGSLEDLWPFNEEIVARAIHASEIPIVSGIGHEIDFTISDFVADQRAATPSAAAERVSPDCSEWQHKIIQLQNRFNQIIAAQMINLKMQLTHLSKRLQHPGQLLREQAQRLDQLEQRITNTQKNILLQNQLQLDHLVTRFNSFHPREKIQDYYSQLKVSAQRLQTSMQYQLKQFKVNFANLSRALDTISPLKTLERGYSIIIKKDTNIIVRKVGDVEIGETINARLVDGSLDCEIISKK